MKRLFALLSLLLLTACATSMSGGEFVQAQKTCEQANQVFEAQVACVNDYILTRNAETGNYDIYYTWVQERNAIMELNASRKLSIAETKLALLDAQNKYETMLNNREMRNIAAMQAMEARRPITCHTRRFGKHDVQTICD